MNFIVFFIRRFKRFSSNGLNIEILRVTEQSEVSIVSIELHTQTEREKGDAIEPRDRGQSEIVRFNVY